MELWGFGGLEARCRYGDVEARRSWLKLRWRLGNVEAERYEVLEECCRYADVDVWRY